ncbi:MAG TPA: signal peptidase I [Bacteroidales bacterium]|nr:signal peptidase I [Bacteroidales bacterium]
MSIYMILTILFIVASVAGLWKIFAKAGRPGWLALIPFLNIYHWLRIIEKPLWWFIFVLVPFINVFTLLLMVVETLKCFKKNSFGQTTLGILFPFAYLPYLGFSPKEDYVSPSKLPVIIKSGLREWADAIVFAVVAATFLRTFMIEAYTIPTPSMEGSLLVGDYLFVSKVSYGPRVPMTPVAFPFAHHTLPLTQNVKAYFDGIQLPYFRFPGFRSIRNNDVVVFNYPDGDTVAVQRQNESYYALVRTLGREHVWENYDIIARPVDKRENYIKRCVGIPGDTLQMINGEIFINGALLEDPPGVRHNYRVTTDGNPLSPRIFERHEISNWGRASEDIYFIEMNRAVAGEISNLGNVVSIEKMIKPEGWFEPHIFPHHMNFPWNEDNYGPIVIPKAGATIELTTANLPLYERIINVYEGNDLEVRNGQIYINGQPSTSYTFRMNHFWMIGDNRHNSADSRFWGFVPEDHIVGRAMFVWLSLDNTKPLPGRIRFDKTFRVIR